MNVHVTTQSLDGALDRYPSVSVSDARATIATVIDGVSDMGQRHLITRHGRPVAAVICMPDLLSLEASDTAAHAALSWPDGNLEASEPLIPSSAPEATAVEAQHPADIQELMRKMDVAFRQDPRLARIVSDVVDLATPESTVEVSLKEKPEAEAC